MDSQRLFNYVLSLGDDALIIAQRLSEWAYKAPFLEEDIALSNISLDMFGRANLFLEYAVSLKKGVTTVDDLAFKRSEREFTNCLMNEQPNGNFAETMVRQFFLDAYNKLFLEHPNGLDHEDLRVSTLTDHRLGVENIISVSYDGNLAEISSHNFDPDKTERDYVDLSGYNKSDQWYIGNNVSVPDKNIVKTMTSSGTSGQEVSKIYLDLLEM